MAQRADIAKRRFIAWAVTWASASTAGSIAARADAGIYRTFLESQRGDTGVGPVTARKLTSKHNLKTTMQAVERLLAAQVIGEGC